MLRVLATSLHLLLVVVAWAALVYVQERQSWPRLLAAGAALGLLTVAFAPALLLVPMVAIWLFVLGDRKRGAVVKALLPIAPLSLYHLITLSLCPPRTSSSVALSPFILPSAPRQTDQCRTHSPTHPHLCRPDASRSTGTRPRSRSRQSTPTRTDRCRTR